MDRSWIPALAARQMPSCSLAAAAAARVDACHQNFARTFCLPGASWDAQLKGKKEGEGETKAYALSSQEVQKPQSSAFMRRRRR